MKDMTRRKFLKLSALTAGVAALSGCAPIGTSKSNYVPNPAQKTTKNWGMLIDVDKIEDFQKIQDACHKFHNVPNIPDAKRDVKWIWEESFEALFPEINHNAIAERYAHAPFVAVCNHCREPVCVKVCPTQATFKNAEGVTMMDMHRCIGCRNCMAACPYGSRSFNFYDPREYLDEVNPNYPTRRKGVVEKCDFCYERIRHGEVPLCVEASGGAIIVGDLDDPESEISQIIASEMTIQRRPGIGTEPKLYYKVNLAGKEGAQ